VPRTVDQRPALVCHTGPTRIPRFSVSARPLPRDRSFGRRALWSACGQRAPQNGVTQRTASMYCRRSERFPQTKIELLKRVSAVRICPGALFVLFNGMLMFIVTAHQDASLSPIWPRCPR